MKTPWRALVALMFTLCTHHALAAPAWSGGVTVDYLDGATSMTVYFTEPTPNPAGCSQTLKTVSWEASDPAAKNFLTMMLTAKVSGRQVKVLVDDTVCLWGGWPKLLSMRLL